MAHKRIKRRAYSCVLAESRPRDLYTSFSFKCRWLLLPIILMLFYLYIVSRTSAMCRQRETCVSTICHRHTSSNFQILLVESMNSTPKENNPFLRVQCELLPQILMLFTKSNVFAYIVALVTPRVNSYNILRSSRQSIKWKWIGPTKHTHCLFNI